MNVGDTVYICRMVLDRMEVNKIIVDKISDRILWGKKGQHYLFREVFPTPEAAIDAYLSDLEIRLEEAEGKVHSIKADIAGVRMFKRRMEAGYVGIEEE